MSSADTDGDSVADISFEYDALGRRVKKGNTVYAYSGQQVVAEYTSGAKLFHSVRIHSQYDAVAWQLPGWVFESPDAVEPAARPCRSQDAVNRTVVRRCRDLPQKKCC